jgi:hypothetical protein
VRSSALKRHLFVLAAYLLFSLLLTYPLPFFFASHVPGDGGDDPAIAWNLWWVKQALLNLRANPFACDYMFYPIGINLAFYTLTVLNAALSLPLQLLWGVVPASNVSLLSSFVLGGYGMFLLSSYLLGPLPSRRLGNLRESLVPFLAGLFYAFASSKFFYAILGQFNIASSQWIPFYVLFLLKMRREPRRLRHALLAAIFFLCQAWAELTYASFLALFTLLYLAYEGFYIVRRERKVARPLARSLALLAVLAFLGLAPILAQMSPDVQAEGDFFVEGSGFAASFSADLFGFLLPTMHHPLLGGLVEESNIRGYDKGQHLYLGYSLLALALLGLWTQRRQRAAWFWALATLAFAALSLGPTVQFDGADSGLPGPFLLVQALPLFKGNRYPSRYSVLLVLSLAVLAAYGLEKVRRSLEVRRTSRTALLLLLGAAYLFEHFSAPLPLSDLRVPPVYEAIAAASGDFAVLDLPLAWRNGFRVTGVLHPVFMYDQFYQTVHQRPILGGNTSRNPEFKFQYFSEAPILNSIIALETGHRLDAATWQRDKALAADFLRFFNIRYVLVHRLGSDDPAITPEALIPYVEEVFPARQFYDDGRIVAYRVEVPGLPDRAAIEPGDDLLRLKLGEGWAALGGPGPLWAQRREARLFVVLNGQAQKVTMRASAPPGQEMSVFANGVFVTRLRLGERLEEYEWTLPAAAVRPGLNELRLHFSVLAPADASLPISLVVRSAGMEVGDFGHVYFAGREQSPNERGYNVVVIDQDGKTVLDRAVFDTFADEKASRAMLAFMERLPEGVIVAVAVRDEASLRLQPEAIEALRLIGAQGDLRGRFRWSHAAIGVKGAAPGQAVEAMREHWPVTLSVGPALTEPYIALGLQSLRFTPAD